MGAILEISDGAAAWWESPDIWVTPGSDPLGAPGPPVVGETAYVWARVHNRGNVAVQSAAVNFWWSNPSAGVTRTLSTLIGTAFVDVAPGAAEEVLCLSPWTPSFVNGGHECLVCEVISPVDPLPSPLPDAFSPPAYRQIAQRNLSVLVAAPMAMAIQVSRERGDDKRSALLRAETGGRLDQKTLATLGLAKLKAAKAPLVTVGLSPTSACTAAATPNLDVPITARGMGGVYLHIRPSAEENHSDAGEYTLVRVFYDDIKRGAGVSFIVRAPERAHRG